MRRIKFYTVLFLVTFLSYFSNSCAIFKKSSFRTKEIQQEKKVRIIVQQSVSPLDENSEITYLPFEKVSSKLFQYVGFKTVKFDAQEYDLTLRIQANVEKISNNKIIIFNNFKPQYFLSLSGIVSLEFPDGTIYAKSFKHEPDPMLDMASVNSFENTDNPSLNLYEYLSKKTFLPKLLQIIIQGYGYDPLISMINDDNNKLQADVIIALGSIKDKKAVRILINLLNHKNPSIRRYAIISLGEAKDESAVGPLIDILKSKNSDLSPEAAFSLGRLEDKRAVIPLINALKDENSFLRSAAASGLGDIKDERAVNPLINILKDKIASVRLSAVGALGAIKDKRAIGPLIDILKDDDSFIRTLSSGALTHITGEFFDADYKVWKNWWEQNK